MTYRSEAVTTQSHSGLSDLVSKARERNRRAGLTGMLLCDGNRFLQTLEGPVDALGEVWASILRDTRHSRIEILSEHIVPARLFSGWDMQLCHRLDGPVQALSADREMLALSDQIGATAKYALEGDDSRLNSLMADLVAKGWLRDALVQHVLEPTARVLGNAWLADDCSEFDLTVGLGMLQLAGHALHSRPSVDSIRRGRYSILLATAPGESHLLGPSLLSSTLSDAGWNVDIAFPDSDEALAKQLRAQHHDAIDIALSDALPRLHKLTELRKTIEKSRSASSDDLMVVSVGGRLFAEATATALSVGADHARTSAAGTSIRLAELIEQRRKVAKG